MAYGRVPSHAHLDTEMQIRKAQSKFDREKKGKHDDGDNYADFWSRALAKGIDGLVLLIPTVILNSFLDTYWVAIPLFWLYGAVLESSSGHATLGKQFMGIYVTDPQGYGLNFAKALLRQVAQLVSAMLLGMGFLMALWTKHRQGLHDLLVGSIVERR